jgi:5'-nucleotidase / UDP-sugar diphosphatase
MHSHSMPLFFAISLVLAGCSTLPVNKEPVANLTILHWNDFHAHNIPFDVVENDTSTGEKTTVKVGGSANFLGYINALRNGKDNVIVLNAGDDFQGTPISGITKGQSQIDLLNIIHPDAITLGNHEFDYGLENLRSRIHQAGYTILAANLFDSTAGTTVAPPRAVKHVGNIKVGLIGLVPPDLPILTLRSAVRGTRMLDVDSVLNIHIRKLKDEDHVNLIVLLSHMGVGADTVLAGRRSDIDVIIGGHSHTALFSPIRKNRTIICQAGSAGRYLGRLNLIVDLRGDSVLSWTGDLVETKLGIYPEDTRAQGTVRAQESLVDSELNEVIGTLLSDWKTKFDEECNTGNWEADVLRAFAKTDIALINSGGLRKSMFAGPIRRRDIWEMNPFSNTLVCFTVRGDTLLRMLEWQAAGKGELMQVSGLRYRFDPEREFGRKLLSVTVNDYPLDPKKAYSLVTNNYVADHTIEFLGIQTGSLNDLGVSDRDILIRYIQEHKSITSAVEGRIKKEKPQ